MADREKLPSRRPHTCTAHEQAHDDLVTFDGRIVVEDITETTIRGGLAGSYDSDNEVSGKFEIVICEE